MEMKVNSHTLIRLRTELSWTQVKLAESAGIHPRTVQRVEATCFASKNTVLALARVLDVEPLDLIATDPRSVGVTSIINAFIWATVMVLLGLVFRNEPASNNAVLDVVFPAALICVFIVPWISRRLRLRASA